MKAGVFAAAACCVLQAWAGDDELHTTVEGLVRITAGERPVLVYRYEGASRPYVKELYTPGGVQVLLDSPPDHVHHHGLMFALGVNDVNFWEESEKAGKEVNSLLDVRDAPVSADIFERIEWCSEQSATPLLVERRSVSVWGGKWYADAKVALVDWRALLYPAPEVEEVRLSGSHYVGLGMRFVRSMDKAGAFILSDQAEGEVVRGDEKLYPGRWCAYTASVNGKPVTVAMFGNSSNKPATTWFTMQDPFAYLSATLTLHQRPMTLKAGETLMLSYAIALWDGKIEPAEIDKVYRKWLQSSAGPRPAETVPRP